MSQYNITMNIIYSRDDLISYFLDACCSDYESAIIVSMSYERLLANVTDFTDLDRFLQ